MKKVYILPSSLLRKGEIVCYHSDVSNRKNTFYIERECFAGNELGVEWIRANHPYLEVKRKKRLG
jgi:hypothetical protein